MSLYFIQAIQSLVPKYTTAKFDYNCGAAELGNYIAQQIILFGLQDGSNEINGYENRSYQPAKPPLLIGSQGNPDIADLYREFLYICTTY